MGLALPKGFHIHNNGIYYSSVLWNPLPDQKAQVPAFVTSAAGEHMNIFRAGTGKCYGALEPGGMINRHVSI